MVYRTREKLIEVARQLFARKGVEKTTMSDIANASEKGRRTLYTYFKNKHEIYEATVERDSDYMVESLRQVVGEAGSPAEKLRAFLRFRLDAFEQHRQQSKGVSINSLLHLDFNRIEKVRKLAVIKEKEILRGILSEGVESGAFDARQADLVMPAIQLILQGVDVSIARNNYAAIDLREDTYKEDIIQYTINSLINHNINRS